ncbi:imelysin family protein [Aurantimonas sp. Leaf443]|uniref:imelysin family protein n=1 Tax=Aurantimonas sp. Leaf443 TaxID=1736378 RepID=UPI0006FE560F|nr:imelysin family protein [Aurantimonas sp. Leaf443]KQT85952.1 hypothetical protein ASG48_04985 [Aurantimonas sp. Leaf443]
MLRLMLILPAIGALLLALATAPARSAGHAEAAKAALVRNAVERVIRPGYAGLKAEAADMKAAMDRLCEAPGPETLTAARASFTDLVSAFSRIEFVRFGPVVEDNRVERLLFFPDRRGTAQRQIQTILSQKDESATSVEGLTEKSVAVQGLGALDTVLSGEDAALVSGPDAAFRCRYGRALAGNVLAIATALDAAWARDKGIAGRLMHPDAGDAAYRSTDDALQEIFGIFIHGLEIVRDLRLKPALGESEVSAKPGLFLFHRSGNTLASLNGNFAGLQALLEAMDVAPLLPPDEAYTPGSADFEFDNARRALAGLTAPKVEAGLDARQRQGFLYLVIVTASLQDLFATHIAPSLGLSAGFSALDGD